MFLIEDELKMFLSRHSILQQFFRHHYQELELLLWCKAMALVFLKIIPWEIRQRTFRFTFSAPLPSLNCNDIMEFLYNRIEIKRPDKLKLVAAGPILLSKIIKVGWSDDSGFRTRVWRHIEHDSISTVLRVHSVFLVKTSVKIGDQYVFWSTLRWKVA